MKIILPVFLCCILLTWLSAATSGTGSSHQPTPNVVVEATKKISIGFCNCEGTNCRYGYKADCTAGKSDCVENPCGTQPTPCACE